MAKRAVNQARDIQGQRAAVQGAFDMHQLAHNHNLVLHGDIIDPSGAAIIRQEARAGRARTGPEPDRSHN